MTEAVSSQKQLQLGATLDVQSIERELYELWKENTSAAQGDDEEAAVMRARVLNLLIYVSSAEGLREANEILSKVAAEHPCRALVMLAEREGPDRDIEMFISAHCQTAGSQRRHLCCEQVTLHARGRYAVELPSAALPLLVPDLPIFLWWRDAPRLNDKVFSKLGHAADRVIIDSAQFASPYNDLLATNALLKLERAEHTGISDLNWARLTSWRTLLANFYDVAEYGEALRRVSRVRIEYIAPLESAGELIAPKALILAGWLVSRLGWRMRSQANGAAVVAVEEVDGRVVQVLKNGRDISLEFQPVKKPGMMSGWITRVELRAEGDEAASFVVSRSEDGRYLETHVAMGETLRAARLLVGGDKSEAELLDYELDILCHDRIYEEAVATAALLLEGVTGGTPLRD
jgi:glucose-6-phosphate dehydrogenase assembly protein OpcA